MASLANKKYSILLAMISLILVSIPLIRLSIDLPEPTPVQDGYIIENVRLRPTDEVRSSYSFKYVKDFLRLVPLPEKILRAILNQVKDSDDKVLKKKNELFNLRVKDNADSSCMLILKNLLFMADSSFYSDKRFENKTIAWFRPLSINSDYNFEIDTHYSLKMEFIDTSDIKLPDLKEISNVKPFLKNY